jgi:hypothetical protein
MENDLKLIRGDFLDMFLPKEKKFVLNYFKTNLARKIIMYYFVFNTIDNFVNHTGYFCDYVYLKRCMDKYKEIIKEHDSALKGLDFEKMEKIQNGSFKINHI